MLHRSLLVAVASTVLLPVSSIGADGASEFLSTYCLDCHSKGDPAGQREFETLNLDGSEFDDQLRLQEVIDQLTLRTMPPEDGDQPSTEERVEAIEAFTEKLAAMREVAERPSEEPILRRLSIREYRHTLADLLGIDLTMFDPTIAFPQDGLSHNFDTVGQSLELSEHLLERFLEAAELSVEKALPEGSLPKAQTWTFAGNFYQQPELATAHRTAFKNRFLCLYDHPLNDKPEGAYGHIQEFRRGVPADGLYEVKVLARAMHRDTPYEFRAVRIDLDEPFRLGIRPGNTAIEDQVHRQPIQPLLAQANVAGDDYQWLTFRVPLDKGHAPRFTFENGIHDVRGSFTRVYRFHRNTLPESVRADKGIFKQRISVIEHGQMPHIRIKEVQIRGPLENSGASVSKARILGGQVFGGQKFEASKVESYLKRFADRAYRRPANPDELSRLHDFYRSRIALEVKPYQAFKDTLKVILCSPEFLYFKTGPSSSPTDQVKVSQYALAERLSYFLTSTMPDESLRSLADQGRLSDPEVLRQETRRLLQANSIETMAADFLDGWLNLRSLGSMPPDPSQFWFYYAANLEVEMKTESQLLFLDVLKRNAPVSELLSSKHSFVNRDLAKLYGMEDLVAAEKPEKFRRVELSDNRRGGLLGHASVLTVSANGIETSPIVRGVWILENILGTPTPPPPDDVPAIEPDTRGTTTIRNQLEKHRENATCFQCHRKIDPLGFALESFDAIGRSRNYYDLKRRTRIDTSGELPGGLKFKDVSELRSHLLGQRDFFVRMLTEKLLTYSLGRNFNSYDRAKIDEILAQTRTEDQRYPLASLLENIVTSDVFAQ